MQRVIGAMVAGGCEEVALEAEATNSGALRLYQKLGFIRDKRLLRYYLSGSDAYRLKLLLPAGAARRRAELEAARQLEMLQLQEGEAGGVATPGQAAPGQAAPPGQLREEAEPLQQQRQHGEHDHQAA